MKQNKKALTAIAALLVFAVFAVGILGVLLGGAGVYRRLTKRNHDSYNSRTCVQYIATRIRQAPNAQSVKVASFGDGDALFIYDTIGTETYLTRVYCYNGWLMELFTADNNGFAPEDGEKLIPAKDLSLALTDGLVDVCLIDSNGESHQLQLKLR